MYILGLYRENGKEHGDYTNGLYRNYYKEESIESNLQLAALLGRLPSNRNLALPRPETTRASVVAAYEPWTKFVVYPLIGPPKTLFSPV